MSAEISIPREIDESAYHADSACSWSRLKRLADSPAMYRHRLDRPIERTAAMRLGTLLHVAALEPHRLQAAYAVSPAGIDRRTKAGKAAWADFLAESEGREVVKPEDFDAMTRAALAVREHPVASLLIQSGAMFERSIWWEERGRAMRGRLDILVPSASPELATALGIDPGRPVVADLKKIARGVDPHTTRREVGSRLYHGQLATYHRAAEAAGIDDPAAAIIWCSPGELPAVAVQRLDIAASGNPEDVDWLYAGKVLRSRLLDRLDECEALDEWPAAHRSVYVTDPPPYMILDGGAA